MKHRWVPRWVLVFLALVASVGLAAGLLVEQSEWASEHPFLLGLVGNFTVLAVSGLIAIVVVDRLEYQHFYRVELDRRTQTIRDTNEMLDKLRELFGIPAESSSVSTWLETAQLVEAHDVSGSRCSSTGHELARWNEILPSGETIFARFGRVDDGALAYACERLDRTTADLTKSLRVDAPSVTDGHRVASAVEAIRAWAYEAPTRKMKRAIVDGVFYSERDRPPTLRAGGEGPNALAGEPASASEERIEPILDGGSDSATS